MSYEKTGIIPAKDIQLPSKQRLSQGPVAIIECPQSIPCDPCVEACKVGAISMPKLNDPPVLDLNKCTGCGACIAKCPGLAIFVIDLTFSLEEAVVKIPYELLPIPKKGDKVEALSREGKAIGRAKVIKVAGRGATKVITIAVKKDLAMEVRNIRVTE